MQYRTLGSTGLQVSVIGVGTWQFGGEWGRSFSQAEADAILNRASELGINLIDTAECYGDHLSERLVGANLGILGRVPLASGLLAGKSWCLRNPLVSAVIPGCKTPAQVEANAAAAGLLEGR